MTQLDPGQAAAIAAPMVAVPRNDDRSLLSRAAWLLPLLAPALSWFVLLELYTGGYDRLGSVVLRALEDNRVLAFALGGSSIVAGLAGAALLLWAPGATWARAACILLATVPAFTGLGYGTLAPAKIADVMAVISLQEKAPMAAAFALEAARCEQFGLILSAGLLAFLGVAFGLRAPNTRSESRLRWGWLCLGLLPIAASLQAPESLEGAGSKLILYAAFALIAALALAGWHKTGPSPAGLAASALSFVAAFLVLRNETSLAWWTVASNRFPEHADYLTAEWTQAVQALALPGWLILATLVCLAGAAVALSVRRSRTDAVHVVLVAALAGSLFHFTARLHQEKVELHRFIEGEVAKILGG